MSLYEERLPEIYEAHANWWARWRERAWALRASAKLVWKRLTEAAKDIVQRVARRGVTSRAPSRQPRPPKLADDSGFVACLQGRVAVMLMGMALEAVIKAVILADQGKITDEGKLQGSLKRHALRELFKRAGIRLDASEKHQLDMFRRHIEWEGRYPAPTNDRGLCFADGRHSAHHVTPTTWDDFSSLFDKAERKFLENARGAE
jgi:hypothetical protein